MFKKPKPKIEKAKLEELRDIASHFENQGFTEDNYDFLYSKIGKFNDIAVSYTPTLIYQLQIAWKRRELNRDKVEEINKDYCQFILGNMNQVLEYIQSKYEVV